MSWTDVFPVFDDTLIEDYLGSACVEDDRIESGTLSAGESTRVNLAKALLNKPRLLLLDEPTASLDPDIADRVRKLLRKLQHENGLSILYTSHNMRDIHEVCDRLIFLHGGKVLAEGTPGVIHEKFNRSSLEDLFIGVARGEVEAIGLK